MENRFEELPIGHFARAPAAECLAAASAFPLLGPDFIGDDLTHRMFEHPKFQSVTEIIVQN